MKICPNCYTENIDDAGKCHSCQYDFGDLIVHYSDSASYVIICPLCNHIHNVDSESSILDNCAECGADLSLESPVKKESSELCIYLERLSTKKRYQIPSSKATVLGRDLPEEINVDSFSNDRFSRNECIIEYSKGVWKIHTENNHGHLSLNGDQVPTNFRKNLNNGDIITIYTCRFRVVM